MIAVSYHDNLNEAQGGAAWAALADAGSGAAPFARPEWPRRIVAHGLGEGAVLAIARQGPAALAMALRQTAPGKAAALTCWYDFHWQPLGDLGLATDLARELKSRFHTVELSPLCADTARDLAAAFVAAGWRASSTVHSANHVLTLGDEGFAAYWAARPGRLRETVRRKAAKRVVEIRIVTAPDPADWDAYERVYRASWKPAEGSPAFLRDFAFAEAGHGRLRLGLATIAGEPVAAQLWTVENGTAYIHKLAHLESAIAHSPGTLLSAALFEHVIDRDRVSLVDFGTGDDAYKRDWMNLRRERMRLTVFDPCAPGAWPGMVRARLAALKRTVGAGLVRARRAG